MLSNTLVFLLIFLFILCYQACDLTNILFNAISSENLTIYQNRAKFRSLYNEDQRRRCTHHTLLSEKFKDKVITSLLIDPKLNPYPWDFAVSTLVQISSLLPELELNEMSIICVLLIPEGFLFQHHRFNDSKIKCLVEEIRYSSIAESFASLCHSQIIITTGSDLESYYAALFCNPSVVITLNKSRFDYNSVQNALIVDRNDDTVAGDPHAWNDSIAKDENSIDSLKREFRLSLYTSIFTPLFTSNTRPEPLAIYNAERYIFVCIQYMN